MEKHPHNPAILRYSLFRLVICFLSHRSLRWVQCHNKTQVALLFSSAEEGALQVLEKIRFPETYLTTLTQNFAMTILLIVPTAAVDMQQNIKFYLKSF